MALNPFFQQGTVGEQSLVQNLINEQIQIYGVEFVYLPRYFVNIKNIMREVTSSEFKNSFPIEGYIESYEGFDSGYNLLTKFGVRTTAEMKIVISQDRYTNYITPLIAGRTGLSKDPTRPLEGDLLYFPYRDLLLEIKYVDDISNFYQLRKNYSYTLTCEPFEYEDEVIDTGITVVDDDFATAGYNATLRLVAVGNTASAITSLQTGIRSITLVDGGTGWTADPPVKIAPPIGGGTTATVVAITSVTSGFGRRRISELYISNPGTGYTSTPSIQFLPEDGNGIGGAAQVSISTTGGVGVVTVTSGGSEYVVPPTITFSAPPGAGHTAKGYGVLGANRNLESIRITDAGSGYTTVPTIQVSAAGTVGVGTFSYGEVITGQSTLSTAFVTSWNASSLTLTARNISNDFQVGELIVDNEGSAYRLNTIDYDDTEDEFNTGDVIQIESDGILDFTEKNPFGEV